MEQYISKSALVAEFNRLIAELIEEGEGTMFEQGRISAFEDAKLFLDTLEVKDPYEQCVQYDSIKAGIQAHAETYSFNIESLLFNQLTKEQQALWRREIEQAVISGGETGYELAKDPRYKENFEVNTERRKGMRKIKVFYNPLNKEEQDKFDKSQQEFYEKYIKEKKGE